MFCDTKPIIFYFYFSPTVPQFGIYSDIYDLMIIKPENLTGQTLGQLADSVSCIIGLIFDSK